MAGARRRQSPTGKPPMARSPVTDDYFVYPHALWMALIPFGLVILFISTFNPSSATMIPWPLGDFMLYMGRSHHSLCVGLCLFAVLAHCLEAAYAGKVCQDKHLSPVATAKWTFMTFLFGVFSLRLLLAYKKDKSGAKQH